MGRPAVGDAAFEFVAFERIDYHDFLSERHVGSQHHERTMSAHCHRERFFPERSLVGGLAADYNRHIRQHARASPLSGLGHRILAWPAGQVLYYR